MVGIYYTNKFGTSQQMYVNGALEDVVTAVAVAFPEMEPVRKGDSGAFFRAEGQMHILIRPVPETKLDEAVQTLKRDM